MAIASLFLKHLLTNILSPLLGSLPARMPVHVFAIVFEALRSFAERFANAAAPVAVTALWQGAVVAAGLALCLRFAPRVAAAHRFWAWAAGFSVLVALPLVPALARLTAPSAESNIGAASLPLTSSHPLLAISDRWSLAIAALWVVLALVRAIDLGIDTARLRRLWKSAVPIQAAVYGRQLDEKVILTARKMAGAKAQEWVSSSCGPTEVVPLLQSRREKSFSAAWRAFRAAFTLGETAEVGNGPGQTKLEHRPRFELCTTRELDRPSVIGFFAPRILIPDWLMERLTPEELEQVVLHEAEHLRRRDDWTNLLQKICLVVFPLNAALMFIERRLCREREMACDEGVVRQTQAPRAYAACLAGLAERHMEHRTELTLGARARALTLGAFERRPELARRVHSILVRRSAMHPALSRAIVGAVGFALAAGAVMLARCPQLVAFVAAEPRVTVETAQSVQGDLRSDEHAVPLNQAASHFRAMNAMVIMADTAERGGARCTLTAHKAGSAEHFSGPRAWESTLRQRAVSAQTGAARADAVVDETKSDAATPRELIVLTAFEQVQSSNDGFGHSLGDRVNSDYAVDSNWRPVEGNAGQFTQTTVTRLIFRVFRRATAGASISDGPSEAGVQPAGQQGVTAIPVSAFGTGAIAHELNSATGKTADGKMATSTQAGPTARPDGSSKIGQLHAVALGNGWFVIQL